MDISILRHLQTRSAVIAVNIIAALALIFAAASVALEINGVREVRNMVGTLDDPTGGQPQEADFKVNEIVSVHLMGNPAKARPARVERAPTTKLNLTLKGLLSTHDQEMARAIISTGKKKKDRLYAVGDKLEAGNATVKEIRDDLVLLDRNGKVESLPLPKKLISANVSADALYIPPVEQPAGSATGEQVANPIANAPQAANPINIPPARSEPQSPNIPGVENALRQLEGRPAEIPPATAPEE